MGLQMFLGSKDERRQKTILVSSIRTMVRFAKLITLPDSSKIMNGWFASSWQRSRLMRNSSSKVAWLGVFRLKLWSFASYFLSFWQVFKSGIVLVPYSFATCERSCAMLIVIPTYLPLKTITYKIKYCLITVLVGICWRITMMIQKAYNFFLYVNNKIL